MSLRLVRFVAVGVLCLVIQLLFLYALERYIHPTIANGIGFVISAQLNFVLSYRFTWHDSARKKGIHLTSTWLRFNAVVAFSACVNAVVFSVIRYILIELNAWSAIDGVFIFTPITPNIVAAIGATIISTIGTFLINHLLVLKPERVGHDRKTRNGNVPAGVE